MTFVNETECKRIMRSLGIVSRDDWVIWSGSYPVKRQQLYVPTLPEAEYSNSSFWIEYSGHYPSQWRDFHAWRKKTGNQLPDNELVNWARYADRFKAASAFRGIKFSGLGERTERGYSVALGVFLSYSALEACWTANGGDFRRFGIIDLDCAKRIRASIKSSENITSGLSNRPLIKAVEKFMAGESEDILVIGCAIRHLFSHGIFTPWGTQAVSLNAVRALNDLSESLLCASEQKFREYFRQFKMRLKN
jgi:hypothetical protein